MNVYCVFYQESYEVNELIGVFSDYAKARAFELDYIAKEKVSGKYDWTIIRKVELDKADYQFGEIGEEV